MLDLKLTRPVAKATIMKMELVGDDPATLEITTLDKSKDILSIHFDGKPSGAWALMSPNRVRVVLPTLDFTRVTIVVEPYSLNLAGVKVICEGNKFVQGPERLLQAIARMWMTETGSIMDSEGLGGLVTQRELNDADEVNLPYIIADKVSRIEEAFKAVQANQVGLMDVEKLVRIEILSVIRLPNVRGVTIFSRVITKGGSLVAFLSTEV